MVYVRMVTVRAKVARFLRFLPSLSHYRTSPQQRLRRLF